MTTSADVPFKLPIGINGRAYLIDPSKYRRSTLPITRGIADNTNEPGEQTLTAEGFWRRSQEDWVDGEGQEFFDTLPLPYTTAGRIRTRVWMARGVDMFSKQGRAVLQHATEQKINDANMAQILAVGARLYYHNGTDVKYTNDPTVTSPTWTAVNLGGATPTSLATDGTTIFIACTNGTIRTSAVASAVSAALTGAALGGSITLVRYCNGRLVMVYGEKLYEQNRDGTTTLIGANKNTSFTWTDITGAPNGIYACGKTSDMGEIYSMGLTSAGAIDVPVWATGLPRGETPNAVSVYGGIAVIATSKGVRVAEIDRSDRSLHYGPVISHFGEAKCLDPYDKYMQFGVSVHLTPGLGDLTTLNVSSSGMGKLNLARFTEPLVPAYAYDIEVPSSGATITSIATTTDGKRYMVNSGGIAPGIYGETSTYVTSGVIHLGYIRFGTIEPKVLLGVDWSHDTIAGAAAFVLVEVVSSTGTMYQGASTSSGTGTAPQNLGNPNLGEWIKAAVILGSVSPYTATPALRRWSLRALIAPQRMDEIILPIILKSRVPTLNDTVATYNTRDEFNALKALELAGTIVDYQEGDTTLSVKVDRVELQPERFTGPAADTTHFEGMLMVRLLTVPA